MVQEARSVMQHLVGRAVEEKRFRDAAPSNPPDRPGWSCTGGLMHMEMKVSAISMAEAVLESEFSARGGFTH